MTPEEKARVLIDQMFVDAGWKVVSRDEYSADTSAAAIEEGILQGGKEADYLLFINGMAVGVLEAKKETTDVSSDKVTSQAENYTRLLLPFYKTWSKPLPLVYTSNGHMVLFRDHRDPDGGYIPMKRIHTQRRDFVIASLKLSQNWRRVSRAGRIVLIWCWRQEPARHTQPAWPHTVSSPTPP